jgi:hypothetical protein
VPPPAARENLSVCHPERGRTPESKDPHTLHGVWPTHTSEGHGETCPERSRRSRAEKTAPTSPALAAEVKSRQGRQSIARHARVCVRTHFREAQWSKGTHNPAAERRNSLAQRGSAGESGTELSSASGAAQFSHRLVSAGNSAVDESESRRACPERSRRAVVGGWSRPSGLRLSMTRKVGL